MNVPGFNLRAKLGISFLLILLPLLVLVFHTYHIESETWTNSLLEDQMQTAQAVAALTDANFDQALAFAWAVANDPLVHTMNAFELDPHLQQLRALYPQYAGVEVNNAAGDLVGTSLPWPSDVPRARDALNVPYLVQVLETGKPAISPVYRGRRSLPGEAFVGVAVPVRDTTGNVAGVVSVPVPLEMLSKQLEGMMLSPQQNVVLTDPQGNAALVTDMPNLSWEQRDLSGFEPIAQAVQGKSGKLPSLVLPFSRETRIGAFLPSPKYGWIVGVTEQQDVALAPVWAGFKDWMIGFAGVALLSAGLILYISSRLVEPIRHLAAQVQILGRGDLTARVQIDTGDELEELGHTFNQMADEIRAREERLGHLAAIVESSDDSIASTTLEGIITSWNKGGERLYGYTADEMIGRPFSVLIPPDSGDNMGTLLSKVASGERVQHYETTRVTKSGKRVDISLTASPLRNAAGDVIGMSAIARDITQRKSADREREHMHRELERHAIELRAANQDLESFTYSVSHDLRTPLASIDEFSRLLQEDGAAQLAPDGQRYVSLIRSGIQQMNELIISLLALSRLSRQPVKRLRVDMNQLVTEVVETLRPTAQQQDPQITVGELSEALADPVLLKQVWINLIANALKFTRHCPSTRIQIGSMRNEAGAESTDRDSSPKNPETVYYVRDNGAGFDMEQADRLFGVFQRLHSEEEYEGNGVGLAIVARIIRRHGGRVWAEGAVGKGATFCFTLGEQESEPL